MKNPYPKLSELLNNASLRRGKKKVVVELRGYSTQTSYQQQSGTIMLTFVITGPGYQQFMAEVVSGVSQP